MMAVAYSMFSGKLIRVLRVFSPRRIYRRKGGVRRWARRLTVCFLEN
jgi:hypothetical protein